jgi:adenylate cyclase
LDKLDALLAHSLPLRHDIALIAAMLSLPNDGRYPKLELAPEQSRVPVDNPALQAVLMALEMRDAIGALTETWRRWGHDIGFGIGIAHGFATLGTIGFEGRFDYAAIGTVSNVASRLCDEAKPGQILISPRVLTKVENAVAVEPVAEFELKGIRRPLAAYNVIAALA